jgi:integrase
MLRLVIDIMQQSWTTVFCYPTVGWGNRKMAKKLTQLSIEKIKPAAVRREIPDAGQPGLYLIVQPNGKRSWAVRYRFSGQPRKYTLPGFPSLPVAHKLARAALDAVADGRDPAAEKRAAAHGAGGDLFKTVAADFFKHHVQAKNGPRYTRETERMLDKDVLPSWGEKRIQDISKRDVLELLRAIQDRGGGLTANRVLSVVKRLFNWCIEQDILAASPGASVKRPLPETSRERVLTDDEILRLWQPLDRVEGPFGPFAKLLLLTGLRRTEVAGMTWTELDLDKALWMLPGTRTKNGRPHEVPLSEAALAILKALPRLGPYVVSTDGSKPLGGYSRGKALIDKAIRYANLHISHWTFHDLRRTAASGMARLGIQVHVTEAVLNHKSGSIKGVAAIYNRYDYAAEKRSALEAWARFVLSLQRPADNIVRLPQKS